MHDFVHLAPGKDSNLDVSSDVSTWWSDLVAFIKSMVRDMSASETAITPLMLRHGLPTAWDVPTEPFKTPGLLESVTPHAMRSQRDASAEVRGSTV